MSTRDKPSSSSSTSPVIDEYFSAPLPSAHNPLIGVVKKDTLVNVRNSISALRDLNDSAAQPLSPQSKTGLYCLLSCVVDAVHFEIEER